jgi:hypothetical protein
MNKIYINSIFAKKSQYGIKLTGKADDIIKEIEQHTNFKGYVNLEIKERKEPGRHGQTHYLTVDPYLPFDPAEKPTNSEGTIIAEAVKAKREEPKNNTLDLPEDDLPF